MSKTVSSRRKQRRNFLKQIKKTMPTKQFIEIKKQFAEEGRQMRIDELRQSLEKEKDDLANQEGVLRENMKSEGMSKKDIDTKIEEWYDGIKIWSLHSDVYDKLV
jgi:DNA replicative helicase MCM subunit Mcm2 (Cdc46/Mcm family)